MKISARPIAAPMIMMFILSGCATIAHEHDSSQSDIGRGIVLGTLGSLETYKTPNPFQPTDSMLTGQVVKIEGGAYVIRDDQDREIRLPIDQHTTIDRPAHIGDWVQAYLDERGRALDIRNIDDEREETPDMH